MSSKGETVAIKARLAKAMSERDGWKASAIQEKHLEAHSLVEALELLLEQQDRAARESKVDDISMSPGSQDLIGEPQLQIREGELPDEVTQRARLMSQFSIGFSGRYFTTAATVMTGFRCGELCKTPAITTSGDDSDYVGLADEQLRLPPEEIMPRGESDLPLMRSLAITFCMEGISLARTATTTWHMPLAMRGWYSTDK